MNPFRRMVAPVFAVFVWLASIQSTCTAASIEDIFGRDLTAYGIVVPDWEGYMANPAIEFSVSAPPGARLPVKVLIAANDPRLYFDLPSRGRGKMSSSPAARRSRCTSRSSPPARNTPPSIRWRW